MSSGKSFAEFSRQRFHSIFVIVTGKYIKRKILSFPKSIQRDICLSFHMKIWQTENLLLRFPNCSFELFYCQPSNQKGLFWLLQKWRKCERFQSNIPQLWSAKYDKNVSFHNHFIDKKQFVLRTMPSEMNVWNWIGLDSYDISNSIWSNLHRLYC